MSYRDCQHRRRGAILVVVLVCLAVAVAISVVVVSQTAAEHQAVQMNHRRVQAIWLAEAGVERAADRLAANPAYAGETWNVSAKELSGDDKAVVRIEVKTVSGQPQRRSVRVEADYADAPQRRCRQVKQVVVDRDAVLSRSSTKAPK
jgi:Tfp pilus assembly protein PilX